MQIAIFGDRRHTLARDWTRQRLVALFATATCDSTAGAGRSAKMTFVGLFGDLEVRVPAGARVTTSGFRLFGDERVDVSPGDGPEVRVTCYGIFSDLTITDRDAG